MTLRVAHITTVDQSLRYLLLNQMRSIAQAGYEVTGISAPGSDVPVIESMGIRHIAVPLTRRLTPFADLRALVHLYRIFRREQFTIVHTHTPKPGLLGQLAARMAGAPVVVNTIHGFYFHEHMPPAQRRFYIAMERIAARCSDLILSQSREDLDTAIRLGICPRERIQLLGNGIDIQRFDRNRVDPATLAHLRSTLGLPPDVPVIGFVGRLVVEKGILELARAVQQVQSRFGPVTLLIVGGVDREKAGALNHEDIQAAAGTATCIFAGVRQDMPDMYALMDVFALPSYREGFPRAPMEASAMGVPCVVTNVRGCREAVEHERNGLIVPLRDVDALAEALISLLRDHDRRRAMGDAGRRMAHEQFDERLVFQRVLAAYHRLLHEKGVQASESAATGKA
ncbi:glycosyltransferase family 4 protein [Roseiflexus sp. RS-1]|uniref:glycosyltransferase family 4 protein n=1 Tax=Roseiflexus sp. (strain RS-1) TaxID=357808 RepID=UPI0000D827C9|nr:glycosyltransferase family 4 protein [Roseiflexus sp. RS-1]ABQ92606.1 glycosyl transferase, group 1 [Roseiflexus sp. RS-1]